MRSLMLMMLLSVNSAWATTKHSKEDVGLMKFAIYVRLPCENRPELFRLIGPHLQPEVIEDSIWRWSESAVEYPIMHPIAIRFLDKLQYSTERYARIIEWLGEAISANETKAEPLFSALMRIGHYNPAAYRQLRNYVEHANKPAVVEAWWLDPRRLDFILMPKDIETYLASRLNDPSPIVRARALEVNAARIDHAVDPLRLARRVLGAISDDDDQDSILSALSSFEASTFVTAYPEAFIDNVFRIRRGHRNFWVRRAAASTLYRLRFKANDPTFTERHKLKMRSTLETLKYDCGHFLGF